MAQHVMTPADMAQLESGLSQGSDCRFAADDRESARVHWSGCDRQPVDAGFDVRGYLDSVFAINVKHRLDRLSRIRERFLVSRSICDDRGQRGNPNGEATLRLRKQMNREASLGRHSSEPRGVGSLLISIHLR